MASQALPSPGGSGDAGIPGGGGFDSELGNLLSSSYDDASGGSGNDTPNFDEPAQPEIGDTPVEDSQQQPNQQDQNQPADQVADPAVNADAPYGLSPDGKFYQVPKGEFPTIKAARDYHQQVSQWFDTPQAAQQAHLQSHDLRAMSNDWMSGSPEAIAGVLAHWSGQNHSQNPAVQQRYQKAFEQMASMVPDQLAKMNPQAYEGMVSGMVTKAIDLAYGKAAQTNNPEDFKRAQELDWGVTGQYKTELPKVDPKQQQLTQQDQRIRDFESRQDAAYKRDVSQWNQSTLEGAKFSQLNAAIEKTLAPVKARYPDKAYNDLREGIKRELIDKLAAEPEFWLEHKQTFDGLISDFKHTWKEGYPGQGMQPRVQSYVNSFVSRAQRYLPSIAKDRIGAATKAEVNRQQNGQFANNKSPNRQSQAPNSPQQSDDPNIKISNDEWLRKLGEAMHVR